MFKRKLGVAAGLVVAIAMSASASAEEYFDGPYIGATNFGVGDGDEQLGGFNWGFASGRATYTFLTEGYYNTTAGYSFSLPMPINEIGAPIGFFIGRTWQDDWRVFGLEAYLHSATVRHDDTPGPPDLHPDAGEFEFDMKTHWVGTFMGTAGVAFGRLMLYGQAGFALGHYVPSIRYDATDPEPHRLEFWTPRAQLGVAFGAGLEFAVGRRVSIGLGYHGYILAPLHVSGPSIDRDTGDPVPGTETDHLVQASAHALTARFIYRFGASERLQAYNETYDFDWGGLYVGDYLGVLWQLGGSVGYNWTFGDTLAGVAFRGGIAFCCGTSYDFTLTARVGRLLGENVLAYGLLSGSYQTGTFFDVISGPYYAAGVGIEIVLAPRVTAFTEWRMIGAPGLGFRDGYIQVGYNFHLGQPRLDR